MTCQNCNAPLESGDMFCPGCGAKLNAAPSAQATPATTAPIKKSLPTKMITIVLVVVLIVGGGIGAWALLRGGSEPDATQTNAEIPAANENRNSSASVEIVGYVIIGDDLHITALYDTGDLVGKEDSRPTVTIYFISGITDNAIRTPARRRLGYRVVTHPPESKRLGVACRGEGAVSEIRNSNPDNFEIVAEITIGNTVYASDRKCVSEIV